ncbi:MAG: hypothetical protein AB1782_01420 [Cyanobacteriota bacterium]
MFKLTKQSAVESVLEKRFGKIVPDEVENLIEINIWYSADNEINSMGICVELKFDDIPEENYQVNPDGIIYSWGNSPIIDERSQEVTLNLENVYKNYEDNDTLDDDEE